jgi:uncharacterized membrane protein YkvA (DUF1232 family)
MSSDATSKFSKMRKLGAFKASLRLLRDPNASGGRKAAVVGATLLAVLYIVFPEFTDVVPIVGWLDEAAAAAILRFVLAWLAAQYRRLPPEDN